jgi:hypothetical protein
MSTNTLPNTATSNLYWCYYKLYVGSAHDAVDFLITDALEETFEVIGSRPWFYLRYIDEQGVHLRLRAQLSMSDTQLTTRLYAALQDSLVQLSQSPPSLYSPLVAISNEIPAH